MELQKILYGDIPVNHKALRNIEPADRKPCETKNSNLQKVYFFSSVFLQFYEIYLDISVGGIYLSIYLSWYLILHIFNIYWMDIYQKTINYVSLI